VGYYYGYRRRPRPEKPEHLKGDALKGRIESLRDNPNADEWTRKFCGSILEGFAKYGGLTERQYQIFAKNETKFSDEALQAAKDWVTSYGEAERKVAQICAKYYKANPPYFSDLADRILTDPDYVPSAKAYRAMCQNKYSVRVLAAEAAEAKYAAGSIVELRTNARGYGHRFGPTNRGVVIRSDYGAVTAAAKGSKKYQILPFGSPDTVTVEEREIKKVRG
tara:strand:- start:2046 stop:2708 length:663 start_codon:yes stop_codon:yes gene_type:complete